MLFWASGKAACGRFAPSCVTLAFRLIDKAIMVDDFHFPIPLPSCVTLFHCLSCGCRCFQTLATTTVAFLCLRWDSGLHCAACHVNMVEPSETSWRHTVTIFGRHIAAPFSPLVNYVHTTNPSTFCTTTTQRRCLHHRNGQVEAPSSFTFYLNTCPTRRLLETDRLPFALCHYTPPIYSRLGLARCSAIVSLLCRLWSVCHLRFLCFCNAGFLISSLLLCWAFHLCSTTGTSESFVRCHDSPDSCLAVALHSATLYSGFGSHRSCSSCRWSLPISGTSKTLIAVCRPPSMSWISGASMVPYPWSGTFKTPSNQ